MCVHRLQNDANPLQMATGKVDNEHFNLKQAMAEDDRNEFVVAMQ